MSICRAISAANAPPALHAPRGPPPECRLGGAACPFPVSLPGNLLGEQPVVRELAYEKGEPDESGSPQPKTVAPMVPSRQDAQGSSAVVGGLQALLGSLAAGWRS